MAPKIDAWFEQVKAFREAFRTLHARSMLECLRGGVRFPGRAGPWSVLMVSPRIKRALLIEYPDQSGRYMNRMTMMDCTHVECMLHNPNLVTD